MSVAPEVALVHETRPIACRTYGFHAGREGDYCCERVNEHVRERRNSLVAGNQIAIDRERDARLAPSRELVTPFREMGPNPATPSHEPW